MRTHGYWGELNFNLVVFCEACSCGTASLKWDKVVGYLTMCWAPGVEDPEER